jgi:hypothetical protein
MLSAFRDWISESANGQEKDLDGRHLRRPAWMLHFKMRRDQIVGA